MEDVKMKNSIQIKNALRNQFKEGTSKMAKRICYGYVQDENGNLIIDKGKAEIIKMVFESYLAGSSLGQISDKLYQLNIKSPTGKDKWNREAIDKLLSNEKYIGAVILQKTVSGGGVQVVNSGFVDKYLTINSHPAIIPVEVFKNVQEEKLKRTRKTKYVNNSINDILSDISLICNNGNN